MADELRPEALIDKDGLKVSKSPWGPDDEIGRHPGGDPLRARAPENRKGRPFGRTLGNREGRPFGRPSG